MAVSFWLTRSVTLLNSGSFFIISSSVVVVVVEDDDELLLLLLVSMRMIGSEGDAWVILERSC